MPDSRFFLTGEPLSVADAAAIAFARLEPGAEGVIRRAATIEEDDLEEAVVFVAKREAAARIVGRRAGLVLVPDKATPAERAAIIGAVGTLSNPRLGFARLAARLHAERPVGTAAGIDKSARIGVRAVIHETAVIAAGAEIGAGAIIDPHAVIAPGVVIGPDSRIGAGVTISHALIGARFVALAGVRIGQAGFGFVPAPEGVIRMPQLGRVIIGDDVEVGANTAIDRGTLGDTVIADGVKIDNLVQIAHNVRIGRFSVIAALAGISGSSVIGERVLMGGKSSLSDHVSVGDGAQIAAASGVMRDIGPDERWGGYPARPIIAWHRETTALGKLAKKKKKSDHGD